LESKVGSGRLGILFEKPFKSLTLTILLSNFVIFYLETILGPITRNINQELMF